MCVCVMGFVVWLGLGLVWFLVWLFVVLIFQFKTKSENVSENQNSSNVLSNCFAPI